MGTRRDAQAVTRLQIDQRLVALPLALPVGNLIQIMSVWPSQQIGMPVLGPVYRDIAQSDGDNVSPGKHRCHEVVDNSILRDGKMQRLQSRIPVKSSEM